MSLDDRMFQPFCYLVYQFRSFTRPFRSCTSRFSVPAVSLLLRPIHVSLLFHPYHRPRPDEVDITWCFVPCFSSRGSVSLVGSPVKRAALLGSAAASPVGILPRFRFTALVRCLCMIRACRSLSSTRRRYDGPITWVYSKDDKGTVVVRSRTLPYHMGIVLVQGQKSVRLNREDREKAEREQQSVAAECKHSFGLGRKAIVKFRVKIYTNRRSHIIR